MPPETRFVTRFAAESPQGALPTGRWAATLQAEFLAACLRIDTEGEDLGEAGEIQWYPDRTWWGRTYVPATARTSTGLELFGYVSFLPGDSDAEGADQEPSEFESSADFTNETAEENPDWKLDLCDEVVGVWRGEEGRQAAMTLVWGSPVGSTRGAIVTAELADLAVDQCILIEDRFTLLAPDDYRNDTLEVKLWNRRGESMASESLYEDDEDE
jgi:hypothetical protein